MREKPGRKEKTVGLARLNQKVVVLDEAKMPETIDGKTADWLLVEFKISEKKNKQGWVFGGFLSEAIIEQVKPADISGFTEGCITSEDYCEGCNAATFSKSGKFHAFLQGCGEAGEVKGKWKLHEGLIQVEAVVYPSCYENCGQGMTLEKYAQENKHNATIQFFIDDAGKIEHTGNDLPPWKLKSTDKLYLLPSSENW